MRTRIFLMLFITAFCLYSCGDEATDTTKDNEKEGKGTKLEDDLVQIIKVQTYSNGRGITGLLFSEDGLYISSLDDDEHNYFRIADGKCIKKTKLTDPYYNPNQSFGCAAMSKYGTMVVYSFDWWYFDGKQGYDIHGTDDFYCEPLNNVQKRFDDKGVRVIEISPDGSLFMLQNIGNFTTYDNKGNLLYSFKWSGKPIVCVVICPDNRHALIAGNKSIAKRSILDDSFIKEGTTDRYIQRIAISKNSQYFILCGGLSFEYWDSNSMSLVRAIEYIHPLSLALSADGKYALTGGSDNLLKYWNMVDGTVIKTFSLHEDKVWQVAFSPDNKYAASACVSDYTDSTSTTTIRIWRLP